MYAGARRYLLKYTNTFVDYHVLSYSNGADWWRIRKSFQKHLSKVQCIRRYVSSTDTVVREFIEQRMKRKASTNKDFGPELSRLFLERGFSIFELQWYYLPLISVTLSTVTHYIAFDDRLQQFKDEEWSPDSEASKLIKAAQDINSAILKTDNGPQLWRKFNTPMYNCIIKGHEHIEKYVFRSIFFLN